MNIGEVIGVSIYVVGAFLLAAAMVFAMGLALQTETTYGKVLLPSTMVVIGLGIATSTLLSKRNLSATDLDPTGISTAAESLGQGATWPLRFATLYVLAACFALLLAYMFRGGSKLAHGRVLMLTFALFFVTNVVMPATLGGKPAFVLNHYYPLLVFGAAFATRMQEPATLLRFGLMTLLALLVGSLAAAAISPGLVLQRPYVYGWIPGLNIRLWGLASHANSVGPMALLYILLAVHQPFKYRVVQWGGMAVALLVLVLAQSKTAWVALFLLMAVLAYYRSVAEFRQAWSRGRTSYQAIGIALGGILTAVLLLVILVTVDLGRYWDRFAHSSSGGQVFSLVGRSEIWDVAIRVWQQNPIFGYGPTLWDPEFRRSIGMSFAFSAHNQLLQSLASAGTVGVLGLLAYVGAVLYYALLLAKETRGLSAALGLFLLLRCMTETPLTTGTLFNGDVLSHLIIFAFIMRTHLPARMAKRRSARLHHRVLAGTSST